MNVAEIRQRIFDQMDYFPDLQQYRDSVVRRMNDRRINDHYQRISDSAHWLFLQTETDMQIRANISGTGEAVSADNTVFFQVNDSNKRQILTPNTSIHYSGSAPTAASTLRFTLQMEGQTLVDESSNEYRIVRIKPNTSDASLSEMFIEPLFPSVEAVPNDGWAKSTNADITNFTIRFDRYPLPADCIEVLGVVDRDDDRGRLLQIDRKREEFAFLDRDNQGEPFVLIEDDSIIDEPPLNAPTATAGIAGTPGNVLKSATEYEYKYTIYSEGRESPCSEAVSVTTGSTTPSVALSNLDNTGWFAANPPSYFDSGKIKIIYRRDKTNNGQWLMVGTVASTTTTFTDNELVPSSSFEYLNSTTYKFNTNSEVRRFNDPGPRQYVRVWYSAGSDRKLSIRYHKRPRDLVSDTDTPIWPRQYHHLLIYATLEDMFLQMQETTQAGIFRARAEALLVQMRRRYLSRDDQRKRFMRFDRPRRFRVFGTPGTSFSGADGLS